MLDAHRLWARPEIENKYWNGWDALAIAEARASRLKEYEIQLTNIAMVDRDDGIALALPSGREIAMTSFAFEKLSEIAEVPAAFVRTLPAPIVSEIFNDRLPSRVPSETRQIYTLQSDDALIMRDIASPRYERTPMVESLRQICKLYDQGWQHPPGRPVKPGIDPRERLATEADVIEWARHRNGLSIKVGDRIAPAALYMDDRSVHTVVVRKGSEIGLPGGRTGHQIAVIKFSDLATGEGVRVVGGLFNGICGNFLIDGFTSIGKWSLAHRPGVNDRLGDVIEGLALPADHTPAIEAAEKAAKLVLAPKIEDVADSLWTTIRRNPWSQAITRKVLDVAVSMAIKQEDRYGDPRTLWAVHSGLTEISQERPMGERMAIDIAASRMLTINV